MGSPKAMQELGKDYDRKPVGAGPMKFVSWNDNEKVVYARNDKYWKTGQPYLDGLEMNVIPEINTALARRRRQPERLRLLPVAAAEAAGRPRQEPARQ